MRDFYDVYILTLEPKEKINIELLAAALTETAKNRGTYKACECQIIFYTFRSLRF
jgi:hypothetical protein